MRLKCLSIDHTDIADRYMFLGDVYIKKYFPSNDLTKITNKNNINRVQQLMK